MLFELIKGFDPKPLQNVLDVANGLQYRDFITVGLLLKKLKLPAGEHAENGLIKDSWIYMQDRSVKIGRLQVFNNWSPYLVKDPDTVWLGLEYFCQVGDELWSIPDDAFMLVIFSL